MVTILSHALPDLFLKHFFRTVARMMLVFPNTPKAEIITTRMEANRSNAVMTQKRKPSARILYESSNVGLVKFRDLRHCVPDQIYSMPSYLFPLSKLGELVTPPMNNVTALVFTQTNEDRWRSVDRAALCLITG
uniref:Uncharacterized protein n=1 Tax=Steinernema glaseri TaxID=37863 RepID=A0A1I7Z4N9_9BILA